MESFEKSLGRSKKSLTVKRLRVAQNTPYFWPPTYATRFLNKAHRQSNFSLNKTEPEEGDGEEVHRLSRHLPLDNP